MSTLDPLSRVADDAPWPATPAIVQMLHATAPPTGAPEAETEAAPGEDQGAIPALYREAWEACQAATGAPVSDRALAAQLRSMTGGPGSTTMRKRTRDRLNALALVQVPPSSAVSAAQAARGEATAVVQSRLAVKLQTEAAQAAKVQEVLRLKEAAARGDVAAAGQIPETEAALRTLNDQLDRLPAWLAEAEAEEDRAATRLRQAEHQRDVEAVVSRAQARLALLVPEGPLVQVMAQLTAMLEGVTLAQESHRLEHLRAGLPWSAHSARALSLWLYQQIRPWMPLPLSVHRQAQQSLDAWARTPLEDLTVGDASLEPRTVEALEPLVGQGTVLVRWRGIYRDARHDPSGDGRLASLAAAGVTRDVLTQRRWTQGGTVEMSMQEFTALQAHYGEGSVEAVEGVVWP